MRFEIQYPSLAPHEVELQGTLAVLGRDPSCDIVINDAKCSRRHAVIEAGPTGLSVRDSGSANGVFVNDKKVDRANLTPGDVVRLGEVLVKVLPEDVPGTVVMGPDEVDVDSPPPPPPPPPPRPPARPESLPPRSIPLPRMGATSTPSGGQAMPAPVTAGSGEYPTRPSKRVPPVPTPAPPAAPPGPPAPAPRPPKPRTAAPPRPAPRPAAPPTAGLPMSPTALVLALCWGLTFLLLAVGAFLLPGRLGLEGGVRVATIAAAVLLALLSLVMAWGTGVRAPWARYAQLAIAGLGLLLLPFAPANVVVLTYLLRPPGSIQFSGRSAQELTAEESEALAHPWADAAFAGALALTLLIGVVLCAVAGLVIPRFLGH